MSTATASRQAVRGIRLASLLALALGVAACAGGPTTESTGEYIDDAVITTKVKSALASELGSDGLLDVEVETFKGTVLLSGFVDSGFVRARSGEVASAVQGVARVDNRLAVK